MEEITKIIEELLFKTSISSHPISDMLYRLNKINISILFYCTSKLDETITSLCNYYKSFMSRVINSLTKYVLLRHLGSNSIVLEEDFLSRTLKILSKITEILERIIKTSLIDGEGNVICKILKPFQLKYAIATPGYITRLPLADATILASLGYVEILAIE